MTKIAVNNLCWRFLLLQKSFLGRCFSLSRSHSYFQLSVSIISPFLNVFLAGVFVSDAGMKTENNHGSL